MSEMNTLEEARARAYLKIREASVVRWGEERTAEIEDTLRKTSDSIARLSLFKFDHTDTPGAFLSEFGVDPETASQGNTSE
jgi:hypothetical protein